MHKFKLSDTETLIQLVRDLLDDQALDLTNEEHVAKIVTRFNLTLEYVTTGDIMGVYGDNLNDRLPKGVVPIPTNIEEGQIEMRARNISYVIIKYLADTVK
jgi:hypothetical protein